VEVGPVKFLSKIYFHMYESRKATYHRALMNFRAEARSGTTASHHQRKKKQHPRIEKNNIARQHCEPSVVGDCTVPQTS